MSHDDKPAVVAKELSAYRKFLDEMSSIEALIHSPYLLAFQLYYEYREIVPDSRIPWWRQ